MVKRINQSIIVLIFFIVGLFVFANRIQANCTSGILGTCQYDSQSCGYQYVSGHCSGPSNYRCCAPNCGQAGGNSCNTPKSGQNCTSLGRTYDCNPCYRCTPASQPTPTPPPSKPSCGSWCAGRVGHASGSWCKCNSRTPDSGWVLVGCTTGGTSDCSTCCAFQPGAGPTPTPTSSTCSCYNTSSCSSRGGTCKPQAQCSGTTVGGLCPCATAAECVCCLPGGSSTCDCHDTPECGARGGHCVPGAQCSGSDLEPILGLCPCATSAECVCCTHVPYPTPTGWEPNPYQFPAGSAECRNALGSPPNVCCRTGGCDSECGPLDKWEYCYAATCYIEGGNEQGVSWWSSWTILGCPVTDSCEIGTPYLRPGICDTTGCTVGGRYKICCRSDGSTCNCLGGNGTGICPSNCPQQGPNVLTCGGTPVTSTPTPGGGSSSDCGHTCLSHGAASVSWPNCSCTNRTPASGYERIGTWNSSDCSQCTGYRQVGCSCGGWVAGSCGAGSCSSSERRYTRTCTPSGCSSEVNCAYDASCGGSPPTNTPPPAPATCTVSLDPSSLTLDVGGSDLLTANVSVQNGSVNQVNFSSNNPDVASVDPSSDGNSPYRTQVTGEDQGGAQVSASVSLSPSGSCSTVTPANITVTAAGWFQTQGGTIHAEGNLSDDIPEDATDKNLSISQYGFPGVISHQSATGVNLGEGYPSNDDPDHWLAKSSYQGKNFSSWTFFEKKYAVEMKTEDFDGTLPGSDGIYYSSSDKTLQGSWNIPAGRWILVLVDGSITVPTNISVPEGAFLGLITSGDINISDAVSQVEGVFIANNSINTGTSNSQFQGEGFFAASQFLLSRDLGDDNPTTPAELFTFRPDFLINSYKDADYNLWWLEFRWEEIAP